MSLTLTISDLDPELEASLRQQAAAHHRSMEAEVREILQESLKRAAPSQNEIAEDKAERWARMQSVVGIWSDRFDGKTTDEIMKEIRGDD